MVTNGLIGIEPPRASRIPPTAETTANTVLSTGASTGEAVTRKAAAAGVTSNESTSSALDRGETLADATRYAVTAAALSTTGTGARGALPDDDAVRAVLSSTPPNTQVG